MGPRAVWLGRSPKRRSASTKKCTCKPIGDRYETSLSSLSHRGRLGLLVKKADDLDLSPKWRGDVWNRRKFSRLGMRRWQKGTDRRTDTANQRYQCGQSRWKGSASVGEDELLWNSGEAGSKGDGRRPASIIGRMAMGRPSMGWGCSPRVGLRLG